MSSPWESVQADFEKLGGRIAQLAKAQPTLDRGTLTLKVPGGRALAEARQAIRDPAVVQAVTRHYGDSVSVVLNALPGTGSENDRRKALERTILSDPDVQRILASLGAELHQAKALTDGE